jgi:hypothetical protein
MSPSQVLERSENSTFTASDIFSASLAVFETITHKGLKHQECYAMRTVPNLSVFAYSSRLQNCIPGLPTKMSRLLLAAHNKAARLLFHVGTEHAHCPCFLSSNQFVFHILE